MSGRGPRQDLLDQPSLFDEVARSDELADDLPPGFRPQPPRLRLVREQPDHRLAKRLEVFGVVDQEAAFVALDLVFDPADTARHHRPALPHRLGHRQAEALRQAFLDDDVGPALEGVDDRGVFVGVLHGRVRTEDGMA